MNDIYKGPERPLTTREVLHEIRNIESIQLGQSIRVTEYEHGRFDVSTQQPIGRGEKVIAEGKVTHINLQTGEVILNGVVTFNFEAARKKYTISRV